MQRAWPTEARCVLFVSGVTTKSDIQLREEEHDRIIWIFKSKHYQHSFHIANLMYVKFFLSLFQIKQVKPEHHTRYSFFLSWKNNTTFTIGITTKPYHHNDGDSLRMFFFFESYECLTSWTTGPINRGNHFTKWSTQMLCNGAGK